MLYKPMKWKENKDGNLDIQDDAIITKVVAEEEFFLQDPKYWKTVAYGLIPISKEK